MADGPGISGTVPRSVDRGEVQLGDKRYVTAEKLADTLGVTPRTLARWHAVRKGPPKIKVGGKLILYDLTRLPEWLESQETDSVRLATRAAR